MSGSNGRSVANSSTVIFDNVAGKSVNMISLPDKWCDPKASVVTLDNRYPSNYSLSLILMLRATGDITEWLMQLSIIQIYRKSFKYIESRQIGRCKSLWTTVWSPLLYWVRRIVLIILPWHPTACYCYDDSINDISHKEFCFMSKRL